MKNCAYTTWVKCSYRVDGEICKYEGYCDFQLPRDSRPLKYNENPMWEPKPPFMSANSPNVCICGGSENTVGNCMRCGFPKK